MQEISRMTKPRIVPDISVIIVNYGTPELAMAAVDSVLGCYRGAHDVDIHLVDNASPGEDAAILGAAVSRPEWSGKVHFYPENTNHGFGRGNNLVLRKLAARAAPPEKVLFLNPDARLDDGALTVLSDALDSDLTAAFAGAGIEQPEVGPVVAAFRFPGFISEFERSAAFGPVSKLFSNWRVPLSPDHPEGPVDWVAGAGVMARFDILQALDFFDPFFFLYFEEMDLMRRAQEAGYRCLYVPRARVVHSEGVATGVKSGQTGRKRFPAYWYHSWAHYFRKSHGWLPAFAVLGAVLAGTALNHLQAWSRRREASTPLHAFRDFVVIGGGTLLSRKRRIDGR